MSVWDLKVTIFIYISIGVCVAAYPRLLQDKLSLFVIGFWVLIVPFLTIIKVPIVTFVVIIGLLLFFQWSFSKVQMLFVFIVLLAAVPVWFRYRAMLGQSELFNFLHWKLLVLCLLVPLTQYVLSIKSKFDAVDLLYIIFVLFLIVYIAVFDGRHSFTANVRKIIDVILFHVFVYFSFSKIITHKPREALMYVSYGFMLFGLIIAAIFIFNQVLKVDLVNVHTTATDPYNLGWVKEYRGPFLRTEGPLAGEAVGLILAAAAGSIYFLRSFFGFSWYKYLGFMGFFFLACITTGSRGVLLSFLLVAALFVFFIGSLQLRLLMLVAGVVAYVIFVTASGGVEDEYGTFDYRAQLFETSFNFVKKNPFGDALYALRHDFDHMRRGPTQFLDIVSVYLQYLLPYGYLGLILYILPFIITLIQLIKMSLFFPREAGMYGEVMKFYAAMIVGYLFMISTVSNVGLIDLLGLLFLAISRGIIKSARRSFAEEELRATELSLSAR